jgi:hypothetical protein
MSIARLWHLAWRDLGRNRRRTGFTIIAVALGMALLMMTNALIAGVVDDSLQNSIMLRTGHIQIRAAGARDGELSVRWRDLLLDPELQLRRPPRCRTCDRRRRCYGPAGCWPAPANRSGCRSTASIPRRRHMIDCARHCGAGNFWRPTCAMAWCSASRSPTRCASMSAVGCA